MIQLVAKPQLIALAQRYVWWENSDWALQHPHLKLGVTPIPPLPQRKFD